MTTHDCRCACRCHDDGGAAVVVEEPRRGGVPAVLRCGFGMTWRLLAVLAAIAVGGAAPAVLLPPSLGVVGGGVLLGFWHRRSGLARLWRWAVLGALLALPLTAGMLGGAYGRLVALLVTLAAACGLVAGLRRAPVI